MRCEIRQLKAKFEVPRRSKFQNDTKDTNGDEINKITSMVCVSSNLSEQNAIHLTCWAAPKFILIALVTIDEEVDYVFPIFYNNKPD